MQSYRSSEYSSEQKYYKNSAGPNFCDDMASSWYSGSRHGQNMMMTSSQQSQYGYHKAHGSNQYGMSKQQTSRHGSEMEAHNGTVPYMGQMSSTQFNQAHNRYGGGGGHHLSQQQHHISSGMEFGGLGQKMHEHRQEKKMFHESKAYSMSSTSSTRRNYGGRTNYSDSEYCSESDGFDSDDGSDGEYYNCEGFFEGRRKNYKPRY